MQGHGIRSCLSTLDYLILFTISRTTSLTTKPTSIMLRVCRVSVQAQRVWCRSFASSGASRVLFFGTDDVSVATLEKLFANRYSAYAILITRTGNNVWPP